MEDLIKNDATFEVYHNSEGAKILNENRVLMSYPSEKSSFEVDLGFDGNYSYFEETEEEKKKRLEEEAQAKKDAQQEKFNNTLNATATAISSGVTMVQALKGDGTKAPSRRKQLKEVCGKRPLSAKKRKSSGYDKCVADYNASKIGGVSTKEQGTNETSTNDTQQTDTTNNNKRNLIIGVVVVGLLVTAFVGYKKGWFSKKAG